MRLGGGKTYARFKKAPLSAKLMVVIGGTICVFMLSLVFFAEFLAPYDPTEFVSQPLMPPSSNHIMGTDTFGRDLFSRLLVGTRMSLSISLLAVSIYLGAGTLVGSISAYIGGTLDRALSLLTDSWYSFPAFVIALLMVMVFGPGPLKTAVAIAFIGFPSSYRMIRSQTLSQKERGFIEAERVIGASSLHVIRHHIAPSYVSLISVLASLGIGSSILLVAALGFLGLGIQPPTPEWGTELSEGRLVLIQGKWWLTFFPGVFIFIAILGFNLLSQGLNEISLRRTDVFMKR